MERVPAIGRLAARPGSPNTEWDERSEPRLTGPAVLHVMEGSRLLEAVLSLRHLRRDRHPRLETDWFRRALNWDHPDGDLLRALCTAPAAIPAFLLPRPATTSAWPDQLLGWLDEDSIGVWRQLEAAFRGAVPPHVESSFRDTRAGMAALIRAIDDYVAGVLSPVWFRAAVVLAQGAEQLARSPQPANIARIPDGADRLLLVPTVLGVDVEDHPLGGRTVVRAVPAAGASAVFADGRAARPPLAELLGHSRAALLYALDTAETIMDLARATGQGRQNVKYHLDVLCRARLVARTGTRAAAARYARTALGDQLLSVGAARTAHVRPA